MTWACFLRTIRNIIVMPILFVSWGLWILVSVTLGILLLPLWFIAWPVDMAYRALTGDRDD